MGRERENEKMIFGIIGSQSTAARKTTAKREGRAWRRRVTALNRHTRRAEAADAAASDEGGVEAGKRVYCLSGGALFSASIAFAVSQPSASVDGEPQHKGKGETGGGHFSGGGGALECA